MYTPEVIYTDDIFVLADAGPLVVAAYWDAPSPTHIDRIARHARVVDERYGRQSALAQFVFDGKPNFSSELREAIAEMYKSRVFRLGTAHVIEISGLRGAATRAFMNTVTLLGRGGDRVKVFSSADEGSSWMAGRLNYIRERTGVEWSPTDVMAARSLALRAHESRP